MAILNGNGIDGGVEEVVEEQRVTVRVRVSHSDHRTAAAGLLRWVLVDEIEEAELVGDSRRLYWLHHFQPLSSLLEGFSLSTETTAEDK